MRIRGAVHLHSTLSRDGTLTLEELKDFYIQRGYQFIAISEHSEDLDGRKVEVLRRECALNSTEYFCMIPGIEFSCGGRVHIPGLGVTSLIAEQEPCRVVEEIHRRGGFSILAHPSRMGWECPDELVMSVDAVEIWNIGYDGKYFPKTRALNAYKAMKRVNPSLLAIASHDFHREDSFYSLAIEMDVHKVSPAEILDNLKRGTYTNTSPFFRANSHAVINWACSAAVRLANPVLRALRTTRGRLVRWST